jgi:ParB family transcriptional regulator, chromosome partitioning protein
MEKKALGKGLDALLPPAVPTGKLNEPVTSTDVQYVKIDAIVPNRYQPRHTFAPGELAELAASIRESGVLQPVLVRRKGDGIFELISGERRWRASKEAGLESIQAVIRNCSDQESMILALVENLQREDLNPMETARAYSRMMNEFGLTQDAIAQKVGCDRSSVANAVRLVNLHPEVQELVESGSLSAGHAKVILGLESPESQLRIARMATVQGLSVRELEQVVAASLIGKKRTRKIKTNSPWTEIEARLQKRLGTRVMVHSRGQGGKIAIHFFSPQELDGIIETLLS